MEVLTRACPVCGNKSVLSDVDALAFTTWQEGLVDAQVAFPQMDADMRELLITGTHAHCWVRLFGEEED